MLAAMRARAARDASHGRVSFTRCVRHGFHLHGCTHPHASLIAITSIERLTADQPKLSEGEWRLVAALVKERFASVDKAWLVDAWHVLHLKKLGMLLFLEEFQMLKVRLVARDACSRGCARSAGPECAGLQRSRRVQSAPPVAWAGRWRSAGAQGNPAPGLKRGILLCSRAMWCE